MNGRQSATRIGAVLARVLLVGLVAVATLVSAATPALAAAAGTIGYDVSWPQCGAPLPPNPAFAVVGVSGGKPLTDNPCLATQYRWAAGAPGPPAFYMNTSSPGAAATALDWYAQRSPNPACSRTAEIPCAYNFGFGAARHAFAHAQAQTGAAARHPWWLDVETDNSWSATDLSSNLAAIHGAIDYLRGQGVAVGIYSVPSMWTTITGGAALSGMPLWTAGARTAAEAAALCARPSFTGGPVVMTQFIEGGFDRDYVCAGTPTAPPGPPPPGLDLGGLLQALGRLLPTS